MKAEIYDEKGKKICTEKADEFLIAGINKKEGSVKPIYAGESSMQDLLYAVSLLCTLFSS